MASLNSAGKQPVVSDLLNNKAITGKSSPIMSLTSHEGAISSWHVLFGAELINFATSSTVTAVKSASDDVTRRGTSYSGVAVILGEIDHRRYGRNHPVRRGVFAQPLSVAFVDADLVPPVSVVLVGVQRPHRLHPRVSRRLRLKRLSAALVRRRAA